MTTAAHLVGSADGAIETAIKPCGRLGLFLGAGALGGPRRASHIGSARIG
jgi:hypothetical protein